MMRLLFIVFFFEVGLVLSVVPWSTYWERNYFAALAPVLHVVITNHFFRGAVSGLGLINLAAAVAELRSPLRPDALDARVTDRRRMRRK